MKKPFPLSRVYTLLEPGPVTLVTTAHKGRAHDQAAVAHEIARRGYSSLISPSKATLSFRAGISSVTFTG